MLKQQIQRLAVAIHCDYAGNEEQQRPEENEYALEDVQPDDAEEHAERVEKVPVACLHAAHCAQAIDREAGADHKRHYADRKIQQSRARRGHSLLDRVGKLIGIDAAVCSVDAELLVNRLKLKR